jgi:hypothetical protein
VPKTASNTNASAANAPFTNRNVEMRVTICLP